MVVFPEECFYNESAGGMGSWKCTVQQFLKEALMLFMAIFSYVPEDRDLVIERGMGNKEKSGAAVQVRGEWFDISGHRVFRLFEAEDEVHLASSIYDWTDIGVAEIIPVMETEKALKFLKKVKTGKKS
jgi:hypothetical protein